MRIVLCDGDDLLRSMVEAMVSRQGHDLVGVADTIGAAANLLEASRPDAAVIDLALGVNADFDVVDIAMSVGAQVVIFSHTIYDEMLSRYPVRPVVVPKPDLVALEQVLARLVPNDDTGTAAVVDRRRRPTRATTGPSPTGVGDAQAFYESLNGAGEGDAMVWIDLPPGAALDAAERVLSVMRGVDRLLASPEAIRVYLAGAGEEGISAFCARIEAAKVLPDEHPTRSVVVAAGETPTDAFERLRRG